VESAKGSPSRPGHPPVKQNPDMPKRRQTIFFDTSVCISAGRGYIPAAEWQVIWQFVTCNFDYAVSPMTLSEILVGIGQGDEAYFEANRAPLRILCPPHETAFLRMPLHFALENVLRDRRRVEGLEPGDFRMQARVTLRAPTRSILTSGGVLLPEVQTHSHGMNLDLVTDFMEAGRRDGVDGLTRLRAGQLQRSEPAVWAQNLVGKLGKTITPEEGARLSARLDAAYLYESALMDLAEQGQYNFSKHGSDWIDAQQLFYLCDPAMHFLTMDGGPKRRTLSSPQRDRIIEYQDLSKRATRA
jgi:hypothetical protein